MDNLSLDGSKTLFSPEVILFQYKFYLIILSILSLNTNELGNAVSLWIGFQLSNLAIYTMIHM